MEPNSPSDKKALLELLKEQYGRVVYTYTTHIKEAHLLRIADSCFKWMDIILSAITTCGLLALIITDNTACEIVSCIAAVLLLAISLYTKEARLAEESASHKAFANKLWLIRERYIALMTDATGLSYEDIAEKRDSLQSELAVLYSNQPLTGGWSYRLAQKALKEDEEQFFSKDEKNKLLPEHLRQP